MNTEILKRLFIELFEVNHIMLDLIGEFENTDHGDEILTEFYIKRIIDEFDRDSLLEYTQENSSSCIGSMNKEELENFLCNLYS